MQRSGTRHARTDRASGPASSVHPRRAACWAGSRPWSSHRPAKLAMVPGAPKTVPSNEGRGQKKVAHVAARQQRILASR